MALAKLMWDAWELGGWDAVWHAVVIHCKGSVHRAPVVVAAIIRSAAIVPNHCRHWPPLAAVRRRSLRHRRLRHWPSLAAVGRNRPPFAAAVFAIAAAAISGD